MGISYFVKTSPQGINLTVYSLKYVILVLMLKYYLLILFLINFQRFGFCQDWPSNTNIILANQDILGADFEPSGIIWHEGNQAIYTVSDHGKLCSLTLNGILNQSWNLTGDLEALTITSPNSHFLYVGVENPDQIKEWDLLNQGWTEKSWNLESWMQGPINQGLEALTFIPNGVHPYENSSSGGLFYAGLQYDGAIYIFDINLNVSNELKFIDKIIPIPNTTDISGLFYSESEQILYAIYDNANLLLKINPKDDTIIETWSLPGNDQEGITLIPNCPQKSAVILIAEDVGPEIWQYPDIPIFCTMNQSIPNIVLDSSETKSTIQLITASIFEENKIKLTLSDQTIRIIQPFSKGTNLQFNICSNQEYIMTCNGKKIMIYKLDQLIATYKVHNTNILNFDLHLMTSPSILGDYVILLIQTPKKIKVRTFLLNESHELLKLSRKNITSRNKKKSLSITTLNDIARFNTHIGQRNISWKIKNSLKIKKIS